jgi:hypothetical protein
LSDSSAKPISKYIEELSGVPNRVRSCVKKQTLVTHAKQKKQFDRFLKDSVEFKVGDLVLVVNQRKAAGESKSFRDRLRGPFKIVDRFNDVNF